jgi:hypothetical protein
MAQVEDTLGRAELQHHYHERKKKQWWKGLEFTFMFLDFHDLVEAGRDHLWLYYVTLSWSPDFAWAGAKAVTIQIPKFSSQLQ